MTTFLIVIGMNKSRKMRWAQYAVRAREMEITRNIWILGRGEKLRISINIYVNNTRICFEQIGCAWTGLTWLCHCPLMGSCAQCNDLSDFLEALECFQQLNEFQFPLSQQWQENYYYYYYSTISLINKQSQLAIDQFRSLCECNNYIQVPFNHL